MVSTVHSIGHACMISQSLFLVAVFSVEFFLRTMTVGGAFAGELDVNVLVFVEPTGIQCGKHVGRIIKDVGVESFKKVVISEM